MYAGGVASSGRDGILPRLGSEHQTEIGVVRQRDCGLLRLGYKLSASCGRAGRLLGRDDRFLLAWALSVQTGYTVIAVRKRLTSSPMT